MPTTRTDMLVEDLIAQHAPPGMIQQARAGHYTDYASPLAAPIAQLVDEAMRLELPAIAHWAMAGKYDAPLDLSDVRRRAHEETRMTTQTLWKALCSLADALQAACVRLDFSPAKLALEAIVERVDVLIDAVREDGVVPDDEPWRGGGPRWLRPPRP